MIGIGRVTSPERYRGGRAKRDGTAFSEATGRLRGGAEVGKMRLFAEPAGSRLFGLHRRGDGSNHHGCHLESIVAVGDVMAVRDPGKIRVSGPDVALLILVHQ